MTNQMQLVAGVVGMLAALAILYWLFRPRGSVVRECVPDSDGVPDYVEIRSRHKPGTKEDAEFWLGKCRCPDCKQSSLLEGPSGGSAQNIACDNCLSEFNVAFLPGGVVLLERMGKLGYSRARLYGIPPSQLAESLDDPQP